MNWKRDLTLLFGVLLLCLCGASWGAAGKVTYIVGTLSVHKIDGTMKILSQKSEVEAGDLLTTEKDSYAQINFTDGSQATLRPNSRFKIEGYRFNKEEPKSDNLFFRLLKGGLRTITGLIGKRGNMDAYKIGTKTATLGIRGSSGDTLECTEGCEGATSTSDRLAPGTYHATYTGSYQMCTQRGCIIVGPGQFGYARDENTMPVLLPDDPGFNFGEMPFSLGISGAAEGGGPGDNECLMQ
ncbi:MAG: FecR family protein [Pseudomonadota bacterium]